MNKQEPAFPFQADSLSYGMDLRDYFAAKAMQGICTQNNWEYCSAECVAQWAYEQADAMMKAREK